MPNRIIKESLCSSEKISALTDFEFRLWIGLITQADDTGRGDARPAIIKGHIFPLRDRITVKDISGALHGLAAKGCISLYEIDGRSYFWFPSWAKHQRIRDAKSKFPAPPLENAILHGENEEHSHDFPVRRNSPQLAATRGEPPQLAALIQSNPIQSESNPNPIQSSDLPEDDGLKRVCKAYEDAIGAIPRYVADEAMSFVSKGFEIALVCRAIQLAAENNVRKWSYAAAILRDCESKGITTLSAFNANSAAKKAPPERRWKEL